jgi:hypothetical protein
MKSLNHRWMTTGVYMGERSEKGGDMKEKEEAKMVRGK